MCYQTNKHTEAKEKKVKKRERKGLNKKKERKDSLLKKLKKEEVPLLFAKNKSCKRIETCSLHTLHLSKERNERGKELHQQEKEEGM